MSTRQDLDDASRQLATVGEAGASFLGEDPVVSRVLDEQQRRMKTLEQAVRVLLDLASQGPIWGEMAVGDSRPARPKMPEGVDTQTYWVNAADDDGSGNVTIAHNKQRMLGRYLVLKKFGKAGQPVDQGNLRLRSATLSETKFKLDQNAITEEVNFLITLFPSGPGED